MTIIVFLPCSLFDEQSGYLQGIVHEFEESNVKTVVVCGKLSENAENGSSAFSVWEERDTVGYFSGADTSFCFLPRKQNWVSIGISTGDFVIKEALSDGSSVPLSDCRLIVYDKSAVLQSELLLNQIENVHEIREDYFKTLVYSLNNSSCLNEKSSFSVLFMPVVNTLLSVFKFILYYSTLIMPVMRFSSLGSHFHNLFVNITWALSYIVDEKKVNLKVGNYILALLADVIGGTMFLYWFVHVCSMPEFFDFISNISEDLVTSLRVLVEWIMGSPGGLKLNYPLNSILGKFFLYHVDLWWSFLGLVRPVLELGFRLFLLIGQLGFTFQTAILADFLALSSLHVYCIYVYAARLYNLQITGLASLSRLFIGCKRNPLPGKIDSCPYTTEQLFVGTIAFTVLLFLLPTTLVYYIVFSVMRLIVIAIGGMLTRTRFLLQSLPLYVFTIWLFKPAILTSSFQVIPKMGSGSLVLYIQPICSPLWKIIRECVPERIERPVPVEWQRLIRNLVMGNLVYPV